jgi:3-oxoadipate enol-lactonase
MMHPVGARDVTCTTSDGVSIACTHWPSTGRDDAPRLVLVHSLALDRHVWDGVIARLRTDASILALDCRGHGASTRRPGPFTAELFARDVAEVLDLTGWDRAAIAGCSMGGCVALAFAGLYPARVDRLGLIDTTAWYGDGSPAKFAERAAEARAKGMAALVDFQLTRWFSDGYRASAPDEMRRAVATFLANDVDCYASTCALLGSVDLRTHLPGITVPTAVVVGEEDYATPVAMAQALHRGIAGSTLAVLNPGRHLTPIECPDRVADQLRTLLARP